MWNIFSGLRHKLLLDIYIKNSFAVIPYTFYINYKTAQPIKIAELKGSCKYASLRTNLWLERTYSRSFGEPSSRNFGPEILS